MRTFYDREIARCTSIPLISSFNTLEFDESKTAAAVTTAAAGTNDGASAASTTSATAETPATTQVDEVLTFLSCDY